MSKSQIQRTLSLLHFLPSVISQALIPKRNITGNINRRSQYIELCGLFLFWEYFMSLCSYTKKNVLCANLWQGEAGGRRNLGKTCDPGLSNGKLIMTQHWQSQGWRVLSEALPGGFLSSHTAPCHENHSRSWQQMLKMSECKRGYEGDVIEGWGSGCNVCSTNKTTTNQLGQWLLWSGRWDRWKGGRQKWGGASRKVEKGWDFCSRENRILVERKIRTWEQNLGHPGKESSMCNLISPILIFVLFTAS